MKKPNAFTKLFPVNLDDPEQVDCFRDDLLTKWELDQNKSEKILRKYHGHLKKYSAMHAEIMYNLLCCHLKSMKPGEQRAYIISKKVNYATLGDITGLEFFFLCALDICLAGVAVVIIPVIEKITVTILLAFLGFTVFFIKQSNKPRFYLEILSAVENDLLND